MTDTSSNTLVNIEDEMKRSYMDYAMSVIIGRALPDVRDGLKPAHRRVLYGRIAAIANAPRSLVRSWEITIPMAMPQFTTRWCG